MKQQQGFTLIELLSVLAILSVLSYLGVSALKLYKANAAYSIVGDSMHKFRVAFEAGLNNDTPPGVVALYRQAARGPISDASANDLLPGMSVPSNITLRVQYDPTCNNAGCQSAFIQLNHCQAEEYMQFVRFGDGFGMVLENIAGAGCA